jgi:hypothetical protein
MRPTGSGDVTVQVSDELDVWISDNGAVRYRGKPTVEKTGDQRRQIRGTPAGDLGAAVWRAPTRGTCALDEI